jgi:catechol 2,3-dioxygenase-like lactoylglutathione lyase family enzyme
MSDQNVKIPGALRPHVSLDVANVETSISFYAALFGVSPKKVRADYAKFELQAPALNFSINQKQFDEATANKAVATGAKANGSLNHLGFEVATTADVLEAKTRLEKSGLVTFDEMDVTCCYAKQDKIWVHDPDGNGT